MKNKIKNNNFDIEFMELIKVPLFFLFKIKIKSFKNNNIFNKYNLITNIGMQVLDLNIVCNYELLENKINMSKNEEKIGIIAFRKINLACNQYSFFYQNEKIRVKKLKVIKNVSNNNK